MDTQNKQLVAHAEFEKRVEIEAANLMYFERLKKEEAFKQARNYVSIKFDSKEKEK